MCEALVGVDPAQSAVGSSGSGAGLTGPGAEKRIKKVPSVSMSSDDESGRRRQLFTFSSREFSNVAWAVAKLKFAPPADVFSVVRASEQIPGGGDGDSPSSSLMGEANGAPRGGTVSIATKEEMIDDFIATSLKVRAQVLEVAKERGAASDPAVRVQVQNKWIPTLSQLGGQLLDLVAVFAIDGLSANPAPQEVANLLWAFATAGRGDAILSEYLSGQLIEVSKRTKANNGRGGSIPPKPQECSNAVWAVATMGFRGPGQRNLIRHVADSLDEDDGQFASQFKPQEMSNTAWGVATLLSKRGGGDSDADYSPQQSDGDDDGATTSFAEEDDAVLRTLRWVAHSLQGRVEEFKPQEISNSIWAFATVGFGSVDSQASNPYNDYIFLTSDRDEEDEALVARTLDVVARNAVHRLHRFRPQELNNLAWGFARLGHWDDAAEVLFRGIGREILRRKKHFTPQDIGTCLWSFATMEYFDEEVYRSAASQLNRRRSGSFKPQECSNAVWALATAGLTPRYDDVFDIILVPASRRTNPADIAEDPITECFAAAANEVMQRPNEFKEQEIKDVMWSFSRVEVRHPTLFKMVAEHLVGPENDAAQSGRGLEGFSPQGLGNLAWSYAKQAHLALTNDGKGTAISSGGRQAVYETSCLDIGETLVNKLFFRIAETAVNANGGMDRFKAQDVSNTCWSFATLGLLHRGYFDSVADLVTKRLSPPSAKKSSGRRNQPLLFNSQEIANLIWSFATLNVRQREMVDAIAHYIFRVSSQTKTGEYSEESIAKFFKRQELANIAWSCAVLEQYPEELMSLLYTGLLGRGGIDGVPRLNQCFGDAGLQSQAQMTLFYVQMAIDMEAPHLSLSLPEGFPYAWGEQQGVGRGRSSEKSEDELSTTSMLRLSSSRMQEEVSQAFNRAGFQHVQEHTIGADDIFAERDIDTSSFPAEFLSIDIANLDEKIGVEVDGPVHFVNVLDDDSDKDGLLPSHAEVTGGKKSVTSGKKIGWQFLSNSRRSVNGPTALKHRLLCHLGWCLIHVPWWEWRKLAEDHDNQVAYCEELLEEVIE